MGPDASFSVALLLAALPLVSACAASDTHGGDVVLRPPVDEEALRSRSHWFGVYLDEHKAGHSHTREGIETQDGREVFVRRASFELRGGSVETRSSVEEVYEAEPPHRLLRSRATTTQGEGATTLELTRHDDELEVAYFSNGEEAVRKRSRIDHDLRDVMALEAWIRDDPSPGSRVITRVLNTDTLAVDLQPVELLARRTGLVQGVATTWYELERKATDGSVEHERRDADGQVLSWSLGGLELRREPEELARRHDVPVDLELLGTVPAEGTIGESRTVKRLTCRAEGRGVDALRDGPGQTVTPLPDGGVRVEFAPYSIRTQVDPSDAASALRSTLRFPADHPAVQALAGEAAGESTEPRARVERLAAFVAAFVEDSSTDKDHTSVLQVIERRRGDCSDHALLFTTLARALDIPARTVMGLVWLGDEVRAFGPHEWCEVVLDGYWLPVDPTWNELPVDAARLRLGPDAAATAAAGGFRVRVLEVER